MSVPQFRPGRGGGSGVAGVLIAVMLSGLLAACSSSGSPDLDTDPDAVGGRPTLAVTPEEGLMDGQSIRLEGGGWPAEAGLLVATCESGTTRCAVEEIEIETDSSGRFDLERSARAAFVSWQGDPIDCRAARCEHRIERDAGAVAVPLRFDPDTALGPQVDLTVEPADGLVDDDLVDVRVTHLEAGSKASFALCEAGARQSFVDRCFLYDDLPASDGVPAGGWTVGDDGTLVADLRVYADAYAYDRRVDCRTEACELVVTARGAVLARATVAFEPEAALRGPARLSISPATGLEDGDRVEVRGSGFYAHEPIVIEQCEADVSSSSCGSGGSEQWIADDRGRIRDTFTIRRQAVTDHQDVDCLEVDCLIRADRYDVVPVASRDVVAPISVASR